MPINYGAYDAGFKAMGSGAQGAQLLSDILNMRRQRQQDEADRALRERQIRIQEAESARRAPNIPAGGFYPGAPKDFNLTQEQAALRLLHGADLAEKRRLAPAAPLALTPGQKAADMAYGKEHPDWIGGGFAEAEKGVNQINSIVSEVAKDPDLTGPIMGQVPMGIRSVIDKKAVDVQERVASTIQHTLRQIYGPQFTAQEGFAVISRAYNPTLTPAENLPRLQALAKQMNDMKDAKNAMSSYFEDHGTLVGYRGPRLISKEAFTGAGDASGSNPLGGAEKPKKKNYTIMSRQ